MKKIFILVLVLVLAVSGFFIYKNFLKAVPIKEIHDTPGSQWIESPKKTYLENKDWYELKINYPENNKTASDFIFEQMENFAKEYELRKYSTRKDAEENLGLFSPEAIYTFSSDYKFATSSDTISYIFEIYIYTGGAHGSTILYPITFDGSGKEVKIADMLPLDKLETVSKLSLEQIKTEKIKRYKEYKMSDKEIEEAMKNDFFLSEGTKPVRDNFNTAWYDGENIIINFGQYQVGPYAEGMYSAKIPRSVVSGK